MTTNWEQHAKDLARVRDELYIEIEKLREENHQLKVTLKAIANNAPQEEPARGIDNPRGAASIIYSYYYGGVLARALLDKLGG